MATEDRRPWYEREPGWLPTMEELDAAGCVSCGRTHEDIRGKKEIPIAIAEVSKAGFDHSFCADCRHSFYRCALGLARSVYVRAKAEVKT